MARRKDRSPEGPSFFEEQEQTETRRLRRQRALFIPRYLQHEANSAHLSGAKQDRAHLIVLRWADRESSERLAGDKETSIDTQFLDQVFGQGLGYALKTKSPDKWQLEHKFTVPGVGTADAALAEFPTPRAPAAVIELKDANTDLDRDRSNGRTAVQQCWDYLNALPDCQWGIVSNFKTIRLYHRSKGALAYEEFTLQELRHRDRFNEFYCLFEYGGLLPSPLSPLPRAAVLLKRTQERQKEVGDDLYDRYQIQRLRLIEHLKHYEDKPLDEAIRIAQKLLDRIIFIAFCEDRELLPPECLKKTYTQLPAFSKVTNPRWHNLLDLFRAMDEGIQGKPIINKFNGGLFAPDAALDRLELNDDEWAQGFKNFGDFDFSEEVNVEVLGRLFERSITELEKLRVGGLFALKAGIEAANGNGAATSQAAKAKPKAARKPSEDEESPLSKMPKSAQRKRFGIYYTPPAFTGLIVERTVDAVVRERFAALAAKHGVNPEARTDQDPKKLLAYWSACLDALKALTVCDPACGSGAFLIRAYDALDAHYKTVVHGMGGAGAEGAELEQIEESIPEIILNHNLYGVDLSLEGVEITQLALWIRSARKGKTLADLSKNIIQGNSLVSDPAVDPKALDWAKAFPAIFGQGAPGGFDCVIGNPPWERIKIQNREFFALVAPEVLDTDNPAAMRRSIAELERKKPEVFSLYQEALQQAERLFEYSRASGQFPLTGHADTNLYMLFAELARTRVAPNGVVGLLVPSGIATDEPTKEFFNDLMDRKALVSLYDFENRNKVFEDVDGRFKFSVLVFGGGQKQTEQADFVFFAHDVEEVADANKQRHITLTAADMKLLNPNTKTCPIFRTRRDADLTRGIYKRVPILIDENRKQGGNPWGLRFFTAFHQAADAGLFLDSAKVAARVGKAKSSRQSLVPVYEAKMVQAYDHRAASVRVEEANWARKGQKQETTLVEHMNPEYSPQSRWLVREAYLIKAVGVRRERGFIAYKDITSATNTRTLIAAAIPWCAPTHHLALASTNVEPRRELCLLGNFNAYVLDYIARQKLGGTTLTFFIMEQLPTLPPDTYAGKCPWSKRETLENWISERVLKLSCTAEDMIPLAKACDFKGSEGRGIQKWREDERMQLRAELDAAFFHLYGVSRDDAEYMLSTFTNTGLIPESGRLEQTRLWASGSIGAMTLNAYDQLSPLISG